MEQGNSAPSASPTQPAQKNNTLVIVLVVVAVLLFCCCAAGAAFYFVGQSAEDSINEELNGTVRDEEYTLNERFELGNATWKITYADDLGSTLYGEDAIYDYYDDEVTSGSWIKVTGTVTNTGDETIYLSSPALVDSQGREYSSSSNGYAWVPEDEQVFYEEIQPGLSYTFSEIYEVGAGVTGLKLKASNLEIFGEEFAYVDLGL